VDKNIFIAEGRKRKFEYLNSKFETNSNVQNSNVPNNAFAVLS